MDLRQAVDMCHRDGSLKKAVAANPDYFMYPVSDAASGVRPLVWPAWQVCATCFPCPLKAASVNLFLLTI